MPKQVASHLERSNKWIFGTMLAFGAIALLASFTLAVDEFTILKNPHAVLSCSLNIVLNCSTVMQTWQSHVFGFPNMLLGLMAFPVIITIALASLAGVRFPRWFLIAANIGFLAGALFAYWLFFSSVYVIQVLCPWCLVVTLSTTLILATMTHYNIKNNTLGTTGRVSQVLRSHIDKDYGKLVVAAWIALLIALIFIKFGASAIFS